MRRLSALALLVLFSFSLFGPAIFASDPDANLPACCRRAGKHACTMLTGQRSSGPAVQASVCSAFPGVKAAPASSKTAPPQRSRSVVGGVLIQAFPQQQAESLQRISFDRNSQKRGPPFSLVS